MPAFDRNRDEPTFTTGCYDAQYSDCWLLHNAKTLTEEEMDRRLTFEKDALGSGYRVALDFAGGDPLVPGAPKADVQLELDIGKGTTGSLEIQGTISHDCTPAWELYVEGESAYVWEPSDEQQLSATKITTCLLNLGGIGGTVRCSENEEGDLKCE